MKQYTPFIIAIIVIIILVILGIIFIRPNKSGTETPAPTTDGTPRQVTLQGESACLPHKDTSGPITLECAFGLKTAANVFYALDMSQADANINPSGRIEVEGLLVPIEAVSSDFWQKYDVKGIVQVSSLVELEPEMAK